jgi:hypothetical protein
MDSNTISFRLTRSRIFVRWIHQDYSNWGRIDRGKEMLTPTSKRPTNNEASEEGIRHIGFH